MLVLTRSDVKRLLDLPSCIAAVEEGFRALADPRRAESALLGMHVPDGGFHAKAATMADPGNGAAWFAAKLNANFPGNPQRHHLPTIQGVLVLFDATNGRPVATMDSGELTIRRTAAATAVAARYLAAQQACDVAIIGCGAQAHAQLAALAVVRQVAAVRAFDTDSRKAERFADEVRSGGTLACESMASVGEATKGAHVIITCTPSRMPFLRREHVQNGAFIAAVGADSEHKSEIDPGLMRDSAVIADSIEQCANIGDLHHAIDSGTMTRAQVRAELADVINDPGRGRYTKDEVVVFDSTGVAVQDVATAAMVFARAKEARAGVEIEMDG
jgi:ornithine cyclodeaminase/alanine dehydrogenase-like protein (mu-crystallin family)